MPANAGDLGSIPGLGRSPGGGHGNPLQYSCLGNPHGQRSLEGYSPRGSKESDRTEQWSTTKQNQKPVKLSLLLYKSLSPDWFQRIVSFLVPNLSLLFWPTSTRLPDDPFFQGNCFFVTFSNQIATALSSPVSSDGSFTATSRFGPNHLTMKFRPSQPVPTSSKPISRQRYSNLYLQLDFSSKPWIIVIFFVYKSHWQLKFQAIIKGNNVRLYFFGLQNYHRWWL